jgi:hypothetical protein
VQEQEQKVQDDVWSVVGSNVEGTPSFFINGVRHDGRHDADSILAELHTTYASLICVESVIQYLVTTGATHVTRAQRARSPTAVRLKVTLPRSAATWMSFV